MAQLADKSMRQGEWGILLNLLGLLLGFGILAKIFEESGVPDILPKYLPNDWKGPDLLPLGAASFPPGVANRL